MPYNSVTEHPGPLRLLMVGTLIFALVSKSVYRISKFALIKNLGKKLNFSGPPSWFPPSWIPPSWIPPSWFHHGYHSGRGCHGNGAFCHGNRLGFHWNRGVLHHVTKMALTWHVTHVTGLGDLLWLTQKPYISILLPFTMKRFLLSLYRNFLKLFNSNQTEQSLPPAPPPSPASPIRSHKRITEYFSVMDPYLRRASIWFPI